MSAPSCSTEELQRFLSVASDAAFAAGDVIHKAFSAPKNVEAKSSNVDLVTETDQECERLVLQAISSAFPDHKFIGEEGSAEQGFTAELTDEPTWMVDPLDGTTNFVHRFPFVCVCIGLVVRKQVVVGVVHNPILKETFTAVLGQGAALNGEPIRVSAESDLSRALLATEIGTTRDEGTISAMFARLAALTRVARSVRCSGSCAMNMVGVATGRLDGFFEIGFGGCWDVAAASLIVTEAGGRVMDPAGGPFDLMARRVLCCANAKLGAEVARTISSAAQPGMLSRAEPPCPKPYDDTQGGLSEAA